MKENSNKGSASYLIAKLLLNSLYGRFGLNPDSPEHIFIPSEKYDSVVSKIGEHNIVTVTDLDNTMLISFLPKFRRHSNINVAIAGSITAYSRMHMSQFLNSDEYRVFYIDTDGIIIDKKLPDSLVDNKKIGLMKLEAVIEKFIGIAPKVYGVRTIDGIEYTKVKGFKKAVNIDQLENLLNQDSNLQLGQEKWVKNLQNGYYSS